MNLDIVREKIAGYLHKNVTIRVYGLRNKNFEYYVYKSSSYHLNFRLISNSN